MSTLSHDHSHPSALFGKTRWAVLTVLFGRPDQAFYLRQLARIAGAGLGAVQREVKRLTDGGILQRTTQGHHVYYQANPQCPIFGELKSLVTKTGAFLRSEMVISGEFATKLATWTDGQVHVPPEYFLETIVSQPQVPLVGNEDELAKLDE